MKKFGMLQGLCAAVLLIAMQGSAFAHNALTNSVPANGQTVSAPSMLMLVFNGDVRLVRTTVTGPDGALDIGFVPSVAANTMHHVPMPSLQAGAYSVEWTVLGEDGHSVTDSFGFNVDPTAPAAVMDHGAMNQGADHGHGDSHSHDTGADHQH